MIDNRQKKSIITTIIETGVTIYSPELLHKFDKLYITHSFHSPGLGMIPLTFRIEEAVIVSTAGTPRRKEAFTQSLDWLGIKYKYFFRLSNNLRKTKVIYSRLHNRIYQIRSAI